MSTYVEMAFLLGWTFVVLSLGGTLVSVGMLVRERLKETGEEPDGLQRRGERRQRPVSGHIRPWPRRA